MNGNDTTVKKGSLDRSGRRRLVTVALWFVLSGAILFVSAGTVRWPEAWVYLGGGAAVTVVMGILVALRNPQVVNERGRRSSKTKGWDRVIVGLMTPMPILLLILAGLDFQLGWSSVPRWAEGVALLALIPGMLLPYLAMLHNPFLATTVRVEEERGHRVATSGPYRYVRHPMYSGIILSWLSSAVLLGSWWALVPGAISVGLLVVRTCLEDRTLLKELSGYADYAHEVRYRLLPGVW